jgi:hypothetical protein
MTAGEFKPVNGAPNNKYLAFELLLNVDLNARTGSADDLICCSENIPEFHEVRDMVTCEIVLNPRSADKVINQSGRELLTLCKLIYVI